MDTEHREKIIQELLELDPSLKEHEAQLRGYIERIDEKKPSITIDNTFVANLRERLLATRKPLPSPYMNSNWWALRLAPLGALALLFLMFMPEPSPQIIPSIDTYTEEETQSESTNFSDDAGVVPGARSTQMYSVEQGGADMRQNSVTQKSAAPEPVLTSQIFSVSPQPKGPRIYTNTVTTSRPGFIVVESGMGGEPFGVSPLIASGVTENVPINIFIPENPETYEVYALFYYDNGDRTFNEFDTPEQDEFGTILFTPIPLY